MLMLFTIGRHSLLHAGTHHIVVAVKVIDLVEYGKELFDCIAMTLCIMLRRLPGQTRAYQRSLIHL
jgi:sulfate adenylyltransferase subunit 1 (EFTu-like GTPase family)